MKATIQTTAAVLLVATAHVAHAECLAETGPLAGLVAIDVPTISKSGFTACLTITNHSTDNLSADEALLFDGETTRLALGWQWQRSAWDFHAALPVVSHNTGILDPTVETWHDIFGLPNGNRDRRPQNELAFSWSEAGVERLGLERSATSLGDARISVGRRIVQTERHALTLRAQLKLPTGRSEKLSGSGGTDVTLGLNYRDTAWFGSDRLQFDAAIAVTQLGSTDLSDLPLKDSVTAARIGLAYRVSERYELGVRIRARERLVVSNMREIGRTAVGLDAWLGYKLHSGLNLRFGFSEDAQVDTQPDVVFRISVGH